MARRVRRAFPEGEVRVVGKVRIPRLASMADGDSDHSKPDVTPDEIRLSVAPRAWPLGICPIEVGVVYVPGAGGAIGLPEVLVRWSATSPGADMLASFVRGRVARRGRRPDERVATLCPILPTVRTTAAVVVRLVKTLSAAGAPGTVGRFTRAARSRAA